jgi:uncharacterized phage protein (TIGR02218 family)
VKTDISAEMLAHLGGRGHSLCFCVKVTRTDGIVLRLTNNDANIVISGWAGATGKPTALNGTYLAATGVSASNVVMTDTLAVDNLEVGGPAVAPSLVEDDVHSGAWDFATYTLFMVNKLDLTMGRVSVSTGRLGEISLDRNAHLTELRGLMQAYSRRIGEPDSAPCRADLYDARCKVRATVGDWAALALYGAVVSGDASLGSIVAPTAYSGLWFACTTAGTSGATEPAWNSTVGGTTADGSVVWTTRRANTVTGTVEGVSADNATIYDSTRAEPGP